MKKSPVADRMAVVKKRYGATIKGDAEKAKPSFKAKPTGNPLKGKVCVNGTWKF